MTTTTGSTALPPAPPLADAGPIQMPGGVLLPPNAAVPSTGTTPPATGDSAVAGATGGGALAQPAPPSSDRLAAPGTPGTTPSAPSTPPPATMPPTLPTTSTPPAAPTTPPPATQPAPVNGGGGAMPTELVPVLQQLVSTLTTLTTVLQSRVGGAQGQAAAEAVQQPPAAPPVEGGGPGSPVQQVPPAAGCGCGCAKGAGEQAGTAAAKGKGKDAQADKGGKNGKDGKADKAKGGNSPAQVDAPKKNPSRAEIDAFITHAAKTYGVDAKVLSNIAKLESGYRPDAVNDWDSNARKGTPSKGMFQFIEPTFKSFAPKAKQANPQAWAGLGELDWMDWRQQALTTAWAIKNGHGSHWATYGRAGGK